MSSCDGSAVETTATFALDAVFIFGADTCPPLTVFRPISFMNQHIRPGCGAEQRIFYELIRRRTLLTVPKQESDECGFALRNVVNPRARRGRFPRFHPARRGTIHVPVPTRPQSRLTI